MKIKFSKKVLSVILAALMVVTSIPLVTLSASAADTAALESAISEYEAKMSTISSTNVYTNMSTAYNAYMEAKKALNDPDSYDVAALASQLSSATANMQKWTRAEFNAPAYHQGQVATGAYSNVVYDSGSTEWGASGVDDYIGVGRNSFKFATPANIVLAYDGINQVYSPIVNENKMNDDSRDTQCIHTIGVQSSSTFVFQENWKGYCTSNEDATAWQNWNLISSRTSTQFYYLPVDHSTSGNPAEWNGAKESGNRFFWNKLYYVGTGNTTDYYDYINNLYFYIETSYKDWGSRQYKNSSANPVYANTKQYVINYKPIIDGSTALAQRISSAISSAGGVKMYSKGGLTDIIKALDIYTASNVNPNTYNYSMNTQTIVSNVASNIKNAVSYADTQVGAVDTYDIGFEYYNESGVLVKTSAHYTAGDNVIIPADFANVYVSADGRYTCTFTGWSQEFSSIAQGDVTYVAQYDSIQNAADFTEYNENFDALFEQLDLIESDLDKQYSLDTLTALADAVSNLTYLDETSRENVDPDYQEDVDEEAAKIASLLTDLKSAELIDSSVANATTEIKDPDQYDANAIEVLRDSLINEVEINGKTYRAVDYANTDELDTAVKEALESAMTYTVYLNGEPIREDVPYGELITLDENGLVSNESSASENVCAWYGYFAAPSYGDYAGGDGEYRFNTSEERLLTNSNTYSFVVKGDSYLTAKTTDDPQYGYKITYVFEGKVVYIDYTDADGNFTVIEPETYAFYEFSNYSGGYQAGQSANTNKDIVITANYNEVTSGKKQFSIVYYDYSGGDINEKTAAYNELVTISNDNSDFYCWSSLVFDDNDNMFYVVYSYTNTVSFYACEDLELIALTKEDVQDLQINMGEKVVYANGDDVDTSNPRSDVYALSSLVPKYDNDGTFAEFSMIGRFAVPENCTVLEKGFLINLNDTDPVTFDVTDESLERVKVLHLTKGNQFVLNVSGIAQERNIDYCAYLIVEDNETGNRETIYSNPVMNVNANEA